jgi:hypothetical protein
VAIYCRGHDGDIVQIGHSGDIVQIGHDGPRVAEVGRGVWGVGRGVLVASGVRSASARL